MFRVKHLPHLAVEGISDVDSHRDPVLLMETGFSSAEFGTIFNIIMNQEPILEEFKRGSSVNSTLRISTERLTHKHAECGT